MIRKPESAARRAAVPVLILIYFDGHIEVFAERGRIDPQVIHMANAGQSAEAELLNERLLELQLRPAHKRIFCPSNKVASGNVSRCTRPTQRLATAARVQLCRDLDAVARKYGKATSGKRASR